eukprot:TRINITY_DN1509_c0_g1_i1.p1 TRINITY_DN1509_c0_g1~~TRINITY_DN1509_c0_g1_i1.p1  ORF type:complete len:218 (+),score=113.09 TRINITY_DN1509_c0_g1_i1:149-802(+)
MTDNSDDFVRVREEAKAKAQAKAAELAIQTQSNKNKRISFRKNLDSSNVLESLRTSDLLLILQEDKQVYSVRATDDQKADFVDLFDISANFESKNAINISVTCDGTIYFNANGTANNLNVYSNSNLVGSLNFASNSENKLLISINDQNGILHFELIPSSFSSRSFIIKQSTREIGSIRKQFLRSQDVYELLLEDDLSAIDRALLIISILGIDQTLFE